MRLAAIGSNCVDYYLNLNGGTGFPGGGPVNIAVYNKRIGGESAYIGPVGTDKFGPFMRKCIASKGVDISHMYELPGKTAVSLVELKDGERIIGDYDEGVLASYIISDEELDFIEGFDVVVCDLWGKVEGCFEKLKSRNVKTAFDCAVRPNDPAAITAIPFTDYLFFSSDDGDNEELRKFMQELHERGPNLVIAMLGVNGSLCYDGKDYTAFGIVEDNKLVDTMGAGDSYIAGFLSGITAGKSILEAMHLGAQTASETLGYFGAWTYDPSCLED